MKLLKRNNKDLATLTILVKKDEKDSLLKTVTPATSATSSDTSSSSFSGSSSNASSLPPPPPPPLSSPPLSDIHFTKLTQVESALTDPVFDRCKEEGSELDKLLKKHDQAWHVRPVNDEEHSIHISELCCIEEVGCYDDDTSLDTFVAGNLKRTSLPTLSGLVCLNLLESHESASGDGPREWVRASLRRQVKLHFALLKVYERSCESVSSCSSGNTEDGSDTSISSDDSYSDESSCSSNHQSSITYSSRSGSASESSGSSNGSFVTKPPKQVQIDARLSQQHRVKLTFALDADARAQECLMRGDYASATQIYRREISSCRDCAHRAATLNKLATLCMAGKYTEDSAKLALKCCTKASQLHRENDNPLQGIVSGMQLGLVHFWSERRAQALQQWKQVMQTACVFLGNDHAYLALLLNNIGVLHYDNGDFDASLRALAESLKLQRAALGCSSPSDVEYAIHQLVCTMGNMAVVFDEGKSQFDRASALLQEAVSMLESVDTFPNDHMEGTISDYLDNLTKLGERNSGAKRQVLL
ncbi:hypothetical protein MPSEU_000171600 [Mayamaea pseudoterrestris]|nr:hypothetical protein MPSEU_000171600 [Mayamaea pseudoterrestris]